MGYFFQETNSANKSLSNLDAQGNAKFTAKQDTLVSGENIKTINNISLLGSGDIQIGEGGTIVVDQSYNAASTYAQSGTAVAQAIATRASTALDNLSSDGQMIIDSVNGTISNCILEIPQNIKLELSNSVLTLKAGSILTKTGDTYTTATVITDKTIDFTTDVANASDGYYPLVVGFSTAPSKQGLVSLSKWNSGSELPATSNNNDVYYNVTDKLIYLYGNGSWAQWGVAYPLALLQVINHQLSFAKDSDGNDIIFNGACFVGHHAVIYPFSKYLLCNGINSDGTMNSNKNSLDSLQIRELVNNRDVIALDNNLYLSAWKKVDKDKNLLTSGEITYVASENLTYGNNGSTIAAFRRCFFVDYNYNGTTVTDFTIRQPYEGARYLLTDEIKEEVATKQADVTTLTGYDATKTQTLKNVSGVLTWVDDE